jgi:hypothetical protein
MEGICQSSGMTKFLSGFTKPTYLSIITISSAVVSLVFSPDASLRRACTELSAPTPGYFNTVPGCKIGSSPQIAQFQRTLNPRAGPLYLPEDHYVKLSSWVRAQMVVK